MMHYFRSDHHVFEFGNNFVIGIEVELFLVMFVQYLSQISCLHNFSAKQCPSDIFEDIQDGIIQNLMIVSDLTQIFNELVYLFLTQLQSVFQLLVH